MSAPRAFTHIKFCSDARCRLKGGSENAGPDCVELDDYLDWVEEAARHKVVQEMVSSSAAEHRVLGPGIAWVEKEFDPYYRVDAFDPDMHEIHPREEHPDCPGCQAGNKHWHRKSDNEPVQGGDDA